MLKLFVRFASQFLGHERLSSVPYLLMSREGARTEQNLALGIGILIEQLLLPFSSTLFHCFDCFNMLQRSLSPTEGHQSVTSPRPGDAKKWGAKKGGRVAKKSTRRSAL